MCVSVSGIDVSPWLPLISAFFISAFCSTAGISGAFLLLPFQISVLGCVSPGASGTNHIFNILACPSGVWRFYKEGRLLVPLTMHIIAGTLPGVLLGAWCRLKYLSNPVYFRLFAACILFYLSWRLFRNLKKTPAEKPLNGFGRVSILANSLTGLQFSFNNKIYAIDSKKLFILCALVGIAGGIYGVGGGAILTPFLVTFFGLPIHAIAGAALFATFWTSIAGAMSFWLLAMALQMNSAMPDFTMGIIFGLGGIFGMYCGALLQKYIPAKFLCLFIALLSACTGLIYCWQSGKILQ